MTGLHRVHLDDDLARMLDMWQISDFGEDPPRYYSRHGAGGGIAPLIVSTAVGADLVATMRHFGNTSGLDESPWFDRADRLEDLIAAAAVASTGVTL